MKKNTHFSTTLFQAIFILATLIMTSCSDKQKSDDSAKVAASENNAKFDNKKLEKDAQFLVDATEINLEEIQLGQLAQEKSSNAAGNHTRLSKRCSSGCLHTVKRKVRK